MAPPLPGVGGDRAAVPGRRRRRAVRTFLDHVAGLRESTDLGGIQPWVYVMVYAAFAGQGAALAIAFACHVRARWGRLLGERTDEVLADRGPPARGRGRRIISTGWRRPSPSCPCGGRGLRRTGRPAVPSGSPAPAASFVRTAGVAGSWRDDRRGRAACPGRSMGTPDAVLVTGGSRLDRVRRPGRLRRAQSRTPQLFAVSGTNTSERAGACSTQSS